MGPDLQLVTGIQGTQGGLCLLEYLACARNSPIRDSFQYFKVIPLVKMQILPGQEKNNTLSSVSLSTSAWKGSDLSSVRERIW